MIHYEIIVQHPRDQKIQRQHLDPSKPDDLSEIFKRNVSKCQLYVNNRVKVRGTNTKGHIEEIIKDIKRINWNRNKPMFVHVKFDNGQELLCHPSQLKRCK